MPAPIDPTTLKTSEILTLLVAPNLRNQMYPAPTEEDPMDMRLAVEAQQQLLLDEMDRRMPIPT